MIITSPELDKAMVYFLCAYYFHWPPEVVDRTDNVLLEGMIYALPLWVRKLKEAEYGK